MQAALAMRNPIMQAPIVHTFSAMGVSSKFKGGTLSMEWGMAKGATETDRYVSILAKRGTPLLVPKDQITDAELQSLRSILRGYLGTEARLMG
jgi:hypothetical protein